MPITITYPGTGEPWGPGFLIRAESDFIGPLPSDSVWQIFLTGPPNEEVMLEWTQPAVSPILEIVAFNGSDTVTTPVPGKPAWVTGEDAQVMVVLSTPSTSFEEIETVQVILDREAGQAAELAKYIETHPQVAAPALTEEEHNAVLQTNLGVIGLASFNPLDMIGDLAAAFASSPPLGFGSLSSAYTLTGDGEMPDIGDLLHTKLGIYFVATAIPAGLSHRHGQSEEYPGRLVQWRTVHVVGGSEMVTEVLDFITHGELLRWHQAKPLRIEYSILPGVVIQARWWQFP